MIAASEIFSRKGPGPKSPGQVGTGSQAAFARRREGDSKMARRATSQGVTTVIPVTTVMPACERDAAHEFSGVILPFSRGELAQAANRTKDAARKWKEGIALPNAYTMIMLGRKIPTVRNWMGSKLGLEAGAPMFLSAEIMNSLWAFMYQVSHQPGPDGDAARKLLVKMGRGEV